jgi:tellurite resistance protein TerC
VDQFYLWIIFGVFFVVALTLDLFVFQRKSHVIPIKEALKLVAFWVALALVFNLIVYFVRGPDRAVEFITAYLIEYSLSIDNLFVFLAVFTYFAIERFHFLIYILGALLLYTGFKLLRQKKEEVHPEKNPLVRLAQKLVRTVPEYHDSKFFVRIQKYRYVTPLLLVLISIESMDVMFAVDSVPAVLGITLDPMIVYTSNIFAILGLRALFFAISGMFYLFQYLLHGLSIVLLFIGIKMLISGFYEVPVFVSLGVIAVVIFGSILLSILFPKKKSNDSESPGGQIKNQV